MVIALPRQSEQLNSTASEAYSSFSLCLERYKKLWEEKIVSGSLPSLLCVLSQGGGVWHPGRPKQSGIFSAMPHSGWTAPKSCLHGSVPGLVRITGQSSVAGHRAILTVSLLNCSRLPRDQGNTQLSLLTKSMVPWEMLGRRLCFTNKQQGKRGHWIRMCSGAS